MDDVLYNSIRANLALLEKQYVEASTAYNVLLSEARFTGKLPSIEKLNEVSARIQYILSRRSELYELQLDRINDLRNEELCI